MFQFVLLVHDVAHEKESGVRRVMATMGLRDAPFWASWAVFQAGLAAVEACLLVGFSFAFQFQLVRGGGSRGGWRELWKDGRGFAGCGLAASQLLSEFILQHPASVPVLMGAPLRLAAGGQGPGPPRSPGRPWLLPS